MVAKSAAKHHSELVPPYVAALEPYVAGRSAEEVARRYGLARVVKLASNENPLGPSPLAVERMKEVFPQLHLYPTGMNLREGLAVAFSTRVENVVTGSGSEGIMANILRTFLCDEDEVLTSEGTFIGFRVLAQGRGVPCRTVPLTADYRIDLPALAAAINERTKIVYLANPNNPTGSIFTRQEFDAFYQHVPQRVLILLDEAYFEYAKDNPRYPDSMFYRYDNVITLRTFSKIYGLAAVRCGYGFAHEDLIEPLMKIKLPFEPSAFANAGGLGAMADREFLHRSLAENAAGLRLLGRELPALGLTPLATEANFVMVPLTSEEAAARLTQRLLERGVIIRHLKPFGLGHCVRISIGTAEENTFLLEQLAALRREETA
ncbi:MAG: histidinol-phosphate transaminase [Bryobacter sp.]|nr:histidinol-phosphate transaminase [Bryobacter sp.]